MHVCHLLHHSLMYKYVYILNSIELRLCPRLSSRESRRNFFSKTRCGLDILRKYGVKVVEIIYAHLYYRARYETFFLIFFIFYANKYKFCILVL